MYRTYHNVTTSLEYVLVGIDFALANPGKYQVKGCPHSNNRQGIQLNTDTIIHLVLFKTESRDEGISKWRKQEYCKYKQSKLLNLKY